MSQLIDMDYSKLQVATTAEVPYSPADFELLRGQLLRTAMAQKLGFKVTPNPYEKGEWCLTNPKGELVTKHWDTTEPLSASTEELAWALLPFDSDLGVLQEAGVLDALLAGNNLLIATTITGPGARHRIGLVRDNSEDAGLTIEVSSGEQTGKRSASLAAAICRAYLELS